jgi:hypothetical protein
MPFVPGKRQLVGSWDWDITRDSATWSDGMFEVYGLCPVPEHNLEIALRRIHEDDRALVAEELRRALATCEPYTATHRIVRTDGAIRWLYSAGRIFTGEDGAHEAYTRLDLGRHRIAPKPFSWQVWSLVSGARASRSGTIPRPVRWKSRVQI